MLCCLDESKRIDRESAMPEQAEEGGENCKPTKWFCRNKLTRTSEWPGRGRATPPRALGVSQYAMGEYVRTVRRLALYRVYSHISLQTHMLVINKGSLANVIHKLFGMFGPLPSSLNFGPI